MEDRFFISKSTTQISNQVNNHRNNSDNFDWAMYGYSFIRTAFKTIANHLI